MEDKRILTLSNFQYRDIILCHKNICDISAIKMVLSPFIVNDFYERSSNSCSSRINNSASIGEECSTEKEESL